MISNKINSAVAVYRKKGYRSLLAETLRYILEKLERPDLSDRAVPVIRTEYMDWLRYANAGMLAQGNVNCFDYAIQRLPSSAPIIEIGSFCGLSTNMLTYCKQRYGIKNQLITCDRWLFENAQQGNPIGDSTFVTHDGYRFFVKETYLRNIQFFSKYDLPFTIEMFSDEFFEFWNQEKLCEDIMGRSVQLGGPISFCYIDGNHSYEYAKRDFENCDRHLEPGGFILFDDSADGSGWDVCKVVKEVSDTNRYLLIDKNPNYFFKKKAD